MHDKYGSPTHVAEFRLFNLNDCFKTCESCFYKRSGNQIIDYAQISTFAAELSSNGYQLETCYLLPTDFFENSENLKLLEREDIQAVVNQFLYLGVACTLEGETDFTKFKEIINKLQIKEVEVQINLIMEKLYQDEYYREIRNNVSKLRSALDGKCVFNIAINLGQPLSPKELERIEFFVHNISDDGIIEINFTFLYNDLIPKKIKSKKLRNSLKSMSQIGKMYNSVEGPYNERTLLRKPAFIFKGSSCHLCPILPFDEYVFINNENYQLKKANFIEFLSTFATIEKLNEPTFDECEECTNLKTCHGKGYFMAVKEFELPCFLEASYE